MIDDTTLQRFWARVDKSGDCWIWTGARASTGYGHFSTKGKDTYAHRFAFEMTYGAVLPGMCICHTCDNPPCCNPKHLFVGTTADNMADRDRKGRSRIIGRPGERNHIAKLTWTQVREIRAIYAQGGYTQRRLARMFGISNGNVAAILQGKTWRYN
jgi:hypothetical protein